MEKEAITENEKKPLEFKKVAEAVIDIFFKQEKILHHHEVSNF